MSKYKFQFNDYQLTQLQKFTGTEEVQRKFLKLC